MHDILLALLIVGVVVLVVFLVLREFWTWFWKQSEQVRLLKSIDAHLARLNGQPLPESPAAPASPYRTPPWAQS